MNQKAKEASAAIMQQLYGAESEVKALRSMTQRMVLTQKEMVMHMNTCMEPISSHPGFNCYITFQEEVVLKRCWLARNWGLAAKYGIRICHILISSSERNIVIIIYG